MVLMACVVIRSGRLLLVRIAGGLDKGFWTLPGGRIEWGEHPDAALLRELEEETGAVHIKTFQGLRGIFT